MIKTYIFILLFSISFICTASDKETPPESVLLHYINGNDMFSEGRAKKEDIFFKKVDANGDGKLDWYLDDPTRCGSQGCNGRVYLFIKSKYCEADDIVARDTVGKKPNNELQCNK